MLRLLTSKRIAVVCLQCNRLVTWRVAFNVTKRREATHTRFCNRVNFRCYANAEICLNWIFNKKIIQYLFPARKKRTNKHKKIIIKLRFKYKKK